MSWDALTLVTDADLGAIEPQATDSTNTPWGASTWATARAQAKKHLKTWIERDHPTIVGVTDRIRDRWIADKVYGFTGSAYTDYTTASSDDTQEDLPLDTIYATAANDRIRVGCRYVPNGVFLHLFDSPNAVAATLTANYFRGGDTWTDLSATDGTASGGASMAISGRVTWSVPSDWDRVDLNADGEEYYWFELVLSAAPTAGSKLSQVLPIRAPDMLGTVAQYLGLFYVVNGLALQSPDSETWQTKADRYLEMAKDAYSVAAVPIDVNLSGAIDPTTERTPAMGRAVMLRG